MDKCPSCGSEDTVEANETYTFDYGTPVSVPLTVTHPIMRCHTCKESWFDYRGEEAREAIVSKYYQVFTKVPRFIDLAQELGDWFNSESPPELHRNSNLYILLKECLPNHPCHTKETWDDNLPANRQGPFALPTTENKK